MPLDTRWIATLLVTVLLTSCAAENEGTGEAPLEPAATTADAAGSAAGDLDGGPSEDEPLTTPTVTGPMVTQAVHLDARTLVAAASDQPFHFMTSVAAIAALGSAASSMLEEIDYDANAEVEQRGNQRCGDGNHPVEHKRRVPHAGAGGGCPPAPDMGC
jgi:hypothetical protein